MLTERGSIEHFGFADGISQPWIESVHRADDLDRRGGGKLGRRGRWEQLAVGEFVLGQLDESQDVFPIPDPVSVFAGGSFVVIRKLEQDVRAFRGAVEDLAERFEVSTTSIEERLVGRTRDGAPLAALPDDEPVRSNAFTYGLDPEGFHCPLGAHVRRANPRDALGFDAIPSNRRRMIRRSMPYGPVYDPADPMSDDRPRGLMFVAVVTRLADQFEFVQRHWINDGDAFGLGRAPDVIAATWDDMHAIDGGRTAVINDARRPIVWPDVPVVVRTRGGDYFFAPSIAGLRALTR